MSEGIRVPAARLLRRLKPADRPVTDASVSLFRLAEACNNACPMCSNTGRGDAFYIGTEDLIRRADFLEASGVRRVVLTGGEPTIHPGFWDVVDALNARRIRWDINTHGRSFSDPTFTQRALARGLERAIVSLHSHDVEASCTIFGVKRAAHFETVAGIENLLNGGAWLMLNCVVTTYNRDHLADFAAWCVERFGTNYIMKLAFPSTTGKGGQWDGIALQYGSVRDPIRAMRRVAKASGLTLVFESFPACTLDPPHSKNIGRSGFGETHYLDDITGARLHSIDHIESMLGVFLETCQQCRWVSRCAGIPETYLRRFGREEFRPITR